jgi:diacylglycerol kinase (ATP)
MIRRELRRFRNRCIWSWAGWRDAWASEPSLRFWTAIVALSSVLALVLPLTSGARLVILPLGVLVLAAELMNTGIERVVDLVGREQSDLARRAKDSGSAAVALTAIAGGVAWAVILWGLLAG